nr:unnamed protein product [Callosobruchus chinensis]
MKRTFQPKNLKKSTNMDSVHVCQQKLEEKFLISVAH